jgi:hypothetical protein
MSADALSTHSRGFYERSKAKIGFSILLGAASLMLLGFCANSAGEVKKINVKLLMYKYIYI